jgi:CheY-like chemotaxis protein
MLEFTPEFWLSSKNDSQKGLAARHNKNAEASSHRIRPSILVVDDQQLIANTTAMVLNHSGFRAERAYNGQSALEKALRLRPDFLLTDILMPGMNGVELAVAVRRQLPATIIVLISGQAGVTEILHQARVDGFEFDLLAKPIHPQKLLEHLKRKAPQFWK